MKSTECLTELFESLNAGTVIITPNKRLSRFVQSQYANFMAAKGVSAWPTLPCYSLSGWYYDLWDKLQFVDSSAARLRVMSASHEKGIWQKIIEANSDALELFNISAAASVARSAWNTLVEWQHDPCSLQDNDAKYTLWAQQYQSYCEGRSLTDSARMVNYLCTSIESGVLSIPANLVLLAFDELTPQTTRLLKVVTGQGSTIQQCDTGIARTKVARIALGDFDSEVNSAARWAANIIEREPDASVGIVIENLAASRAKVEGIFTSVFEPQYILPDRQCHASGFNISAAQPLATTPPVAAALRALRLNFRELDIEEISHFLHSPFISCLSELPARAQLEHELREQALKIRMSHLRTRAGDFGVKKAGQDKRETTLESTHEATLETTPESTPESTPETIQKAAPKQTKPTGELYKSLHAFHQTTLVLPKVCSASEWGQIFCGQLDALGWPGQRQLDTLEYQQVQAWQALVSQFASFDYVFPPLTLAEALSYLTGLAQESQFQAQTTSSPVQLLGVLEAAGMMFDYLWVMSMDNEHWPPSPQPNSLLPLALQRAEAMPRASAEKELELAKQLTVRFSKSADSVVFSHALLDGDKMLTASRLIEPFAEIYIDALIMDGVHSHTHNYAHKSYAQILSTVGGTELFLDEMGPAVVNPSAIKGGTQILKDQAACPFRSFAKHRLNARELQEWQVGISAADRGSLMHSALELIWKALLDQAALLAMDDLALEEIIGGSVEKSFVVLSKKVSVGERLKSLERERMTVLLRAWLELEKQRAPFVVETNETNTEINLARLPIRIRYDRIDRLDSGGLFIIDYKTGKTNIKSWTSERPDEPQVPLYCLANQAEVVAAAFGEINSNEIAFKGMGENAEASPGLRAPAELASLGIADTWQEVVANWRVTLTNIAEEFVQGKAAVVPKNIKQSCTYCSFHSVCRIKETIDIPEAIESSLTMAETKHA